MSNLQCLEMAYRIVTDNRNQNKYAFTQLRDMDTLNTYCYQDMINDMKKMLVEQGDMKKEATHDPDN